MSLHSNSHLVSSHQAELAQHAAEHRLAAKERSVSVTPTTADADTPGASPVRRILVQMVSGLRPVRYGVNPRG